MELRPEVQRSLASHTLNTLVIVTLTHSASRSPSTPRPLPGTEPHVPQPGLLLPGAQRFEWWLLCCYIKTDPGKSLLLHILSRCPVKKGADVEVMKDGCSAKISGAAACAGGGHPAEAAGFLRGTVPCSGHTALCTTTTAQLP